MPQAAPPAPAAAPPVPEPQPLPSVEEAVPEPQPWPEPVSAEPEPVLEAEPEPIASQAEPERGVPTAAEVFLEPQPASEPAPEPEPLPIEPGDFVAVEAAAPGFDMPAGPLDDPFAAWDSSGPRDVGDDVFAMPQAEAPPVAGEPEPAAEGAQDSGSSARR